MKAVNRLVLAVSFMFASMANANVILSLDPTTQTSPGGELISVTLRIDGLGNEVPLSLSAFDIDLKYDMSALAFAGYNLFDDLGVVGPIGTLADAEDWSWGEFAPGFINIAEVSYLDTFDLWDFQPGGFALAELFFTSIKPATSAISIVYADLTDAGGSPDPINVIGVNNASIEVPAPAALTLMGLALLTMFGRQKINATGFNK
ncbi:MAG: hypothetical protein ABJK37_14035 [Paraglaciecola sp.]|uniref:hypothetical protein n=1 Tax=Paraglaciecola sp. TaxID=1920173 RepID=UPI003297D5C1